MFIYLLLSRLGATILASYSNMSNNLAESHDSSRNVIKVDLQNNIAFNDTTMLKRLRVHQVDDNFLSTCAAIKVNNTEDIIILEELVKQASQKTLDDFEDEERLL
jgi:hypothetical protein